MPILHTVNKSPFEHASLQSCIRHALRGSAVLLFEDGVYAGLRGSAYEGLAREALGRVRLYALGPDLQARGIPRERLVPGIEVVDYDGFVALAVECDTVQAWL